MAMSVSSNITTSLVSEIIKKLSIDNKQTREMKKAINMSVTDTGHGSIFLGSSSRLENGDGNIRMLVGAHRGRQLKIGIFGGKCEKGEETIITMIRETIEEIFNFKAHPLMIRHIKVFLNENPDLYYIHQMGRKHTAYSYFFDVSILGVFIQIIRDIPSLKDTIHFIPTGSSMTNIQEFLKTNIKMTDLSSVDGPSIDGFETTIELVNFIKKRYISEKNLKMCRQMGATHQSGLDEIKYLSFVSLNKIIDAPFQNNKYELFNFVKNRREELPLDEFLVRILENDIIVQILDHT